VQGLWPSARRALVNGARRKKTEAGRQLRGRGCQR
jgi:hypothetical protein